MPLVVPGIQSKDGNSKEEWMTKLMGKKIGEQHDEVVSFALTSPSFLLYLFKHVDNYLHVWTEQLTS